MSTPRSPQHNNITEQLAKTLLLPSRSCRDLPLCPRRSLRCRRHYCGYYLLLFPPPRQLGWGGWLGTAPEGRGHRGKTSRHSTIEHHRPSVWVLGGPRPSSPCQEGHSQRNPLPKSFPPPATRSWTPNTHQVLPWLSRELPIDLGLSGGAMGTGSAGISLGDLSSGTMGTGSALGDQPAHPRQGLGLKSDPKEVWCQGDQPLLCLSSSITTRQPRPGSRRDSKRAAPLGYRPPRTGKQGFCSTAVPGGGGGEGVYTLHTNTRSRVRHTQTLRNTLHTALCTGVSAPTQSAGHFWGAHPPRQPQTRTPCPSPCRGTH